MESNVAHQIEFSEKKISVCFASSQRVGVLRECDPTIKEEEVPPNGYRKKIKKVQKKSEKSKQLKKMGKNL